jgi:hypothetical protein
LLRMPVFDSDTMLRRTASIWLVLSSRITLRRLKKPRVGMALRFRRKRHDFA